MAHVKTISSRDIDALYEKTFQGHRLRNAVDNAGQTLWVPISPYSEPTKARLAVLMDKTKDEPEVEQARANLMQFHSVLISNPLMEGKSSPVEKKYGKEQLHTYFSLVQDLQPESQDFSREAMRETLRVLRLPPALDKEELKARLPAFLQSIAPAIGRG